jgi:pilus assembly protein Flp/PilA
MARIYTALGFSPYLYGRHRQGAPPFPGDQKTRAGIKMKTLVKFLKDESGATAIEYGLIAAGIAIAIITAVQGVGTQLSTNFGTISSSLK